MDTWTMAVCGREKERRERKKKGEKWEAAVVFNLRVRLNGQNRKVGLFLCAGDLF